jgi:hypothetical protein
LLVGMVQAQPVDPDPPGRVGRIAETSGPAWLWSPDTGEWIEAVPNRPVPSGDRLATDRGARDELDVGSTTLRLDADTELINPILTMLSDEMEDGWEGCLSVPGLRGVVPRHVRLRYRGLAPNGDVIDREAEGFHARVVQHECDHLDGILYPMRVRDFTRFGFTNVLFPELPDSELE